MRAFFAGGGAGHDFISSFDAAFEAQVLCGNGRAGPWELAIEQPGQQRLHPHGLGLHRRGGRPLAVGYVKGVHIAANQGEGLNFERAQFARHIGGVAYADFIECKVGEGRVTSDKVFVPGIA